jgi:hypothetical protein
MKKNDSLMDFITALTQKLEASKPREAVAPRALEESPAEKSPAAGELAADGSIYLGYYNDKDWFVTAKDAKSVLRNMTMNFNEAAKYAKKLKVHGHTDWMLPPGESDPQEPNILNEMYKNKDTGAFQGTYNDSSTAYDKHWYWSSTPSPTNEVSAFQMNFSNHASITWSKNNQISVRPVRSVPRPQKVG